MKKICIIVPNKLPIPDVRGGAVERLVSMIIDEYEKENNHKFEIVIVSPYDVYALEASHKYKKVKFIYIEPHYYSKNIIRRVTSYLFWKLKNVRYYELLYLKEAYRRIKNENLDCIIAEGGELKNYRYIRNKQKNVTIIAHLHWNDIISQEYSQIFNYFIAVSNYIKKACNKNNIVDCEKIYVLNNCIDLSRFENKSKDNYKIRKSLNIKDNEKVIYFCGRTVRQKGVKELIQAFRLTKCYNNTKLVIIGNSEFGNSVMTAYDTELLELAKKCDGRVLLLGFIPNDKLSKYQAIADLAIVPSLYEEPFGLVVLEAMAAGIPLITTNSGAIPDIVDSNCAVIINKEKDVVSELALAIDSVIENDSKLLELKNNSLELVKEYSIEKYYRNFKKIISKI